MNPYSEKVCFLVALLLAGWTASGVRAQQRPIELTRRDVRFELLRPIEAVGVNRIAGNRSVPLAFGMSALLPGAGQAYNRQWVKAAVSLGLEAAIVTGYVTYRTRGLDAEDEFRDVAHASWDPSRYASWLNDFTEYLERDYGATFTGPPVDTDIGVDFSQPDTWSEAERQAVGRMFSQIRNLERQSFHPETGAAFSHQIPGFGEQQYYELIGKYFEFAPGWEDYPQWRDGEEFTEAIDPELSGEGGTKVNVSDEFYAYAHDHARAQDLLRKASRISLLFIVNHLVAAVDAAVSAKLHNDRVSSRMGFSYGPDGRATPVVSLAVSF